MKINYKYAKKRAKVHSMEVSTFYVCVNIGCEAEMKRTTKMENKTKKE